MMRRHNDLTQLLTQSNRPPVLKTKAAILFAVLAAVCYGVSAPLSKLLLAEIPPALMAALLYLGAGLGMAVINISRIIKRSEHFPVKEHSHLHTHEGLVHSHYHTPDTHHTHAH